LTQQVGNSPRSRFRSSRLTCVCL